MSVGKITAALASATNEVTFAAANLNFDFSLVKLAPPKEFSTIGLSLSEKRREDAEHGPAHITARKLGALFEGLIPSTPHLIRQYGLRSSQISASPIINPKGSAKDGLFASQVGLDGTTLWAAATSGAPAISVHLLACMLARIWSGPEATSIWVQIVEDRRKEIEKTLDNDAVHYKTWAAARHNFTRQQLAEWDASARAWLYEADKVHQRQQQQLLLILNNIEVAVNHKPEVYNNVMTTWKTSMETLDAIVQGVPQQVQNGAVLLGLSAWHLYPDMHIIGDSPKEIKMKDVLVAEGGTITLGLQHGGREGPRGVHWSLSLAHLKYYGKPVMTTRSTESDSSRISFDELWTVGLGSLWSMWGATTSLGDVLSGAKFIATLWDTIDQAFHHDLAFQRSFNPKTFNWLKSLAQASRNLIESEEVDHDTSMRLFGLGRRIGAKFLSVKGAPCVPSVFGLDSTEVLLSVLSNEGLIILFRQYIEEFYLEKIMFESAIIRYVQPSTDLVYTDSSTEFEPEEVSADAPSAEELLGPPFLEELNEAGQLLRELDNNKGSSTPSKRVHTFAYASIRQYPLSSRKRSHTGDHLKGENFRWKPRSVAQYINAEGKIIKGAINTSNIEVDPFYKLNNDEVIREQKWDDIHSIDKDTIMWKNNHGEEPVLYKRVLGSPHTAALFIHEHHTLLPQLNGELLALSLPWERMIAIFSQMQYLSATLCQVFNDSQQKYGGDTHKLPPNLRTDKSVFMGDDTPPHPMQLPVASHGQKPLADAEIMEEFIPDMYDVDEMLSDNPYIQNYEIPIDRPTVDPSTAGLGLDTWRIPPPIQDLDICLGLRDYSSVRVLQCLSSIYQLLPHATIPCKIVQTPILSYPWAKSASSRLKVFLTHTSSTNYFHLNRNESFEAIASFETGYTDIVMSEDVMALACGNSLYVAGPLLCDPYETPHDHEIRHIVGNIGRAGIALFVPPKDMQIKNAGAEDWSLVHHDSFDGKPMDSFKATTLHLSFTGFETALRTERFGHRDVEIFYLETLISLHDRGSWIADIDVLKALRDPVFQRLKFTSCNHDVPPKQETGLISIDNWSEVLDKPDDHCIARANQNWLARLALVSVNVQKGANTVLLPPKPCWACISARTGRLRPRHRGTVMRGDPWMILRTVSDCYACHRSKALQENNPRNEGPFTLIW